MVSFCCSLSETIDHSPLFILILQQFVWAPVYSKTDLARHIWKRGHSEWERGDRQLPISLRDLVAIHVDIETLLGVATSVPANNQDTLRINLAWAETLSGTEGRQTWWWLQVVSLPSWDDVLAEHRNIKFLNSIDVAACLVVNTAENEDWFTLKSTAWVVVAFGSHIGQVLPLILVNVINLASDAWTDTPTSSHDVAVTDRASGVAVSWMLHISTCLESVVITLLHKFTALNMWLLFRVLVITTSDHKHVSVGSRLHNLEVVREHVVLALAKLWVNFVSCLVLDSVGVTCLCQQVINYHFEAIVVKDEHFIADRGTSHEVGGVTSIIWSSFWSYFLRQNFLDIFFSSLGRGRYLITSFSMFKNIVIKVSIFASWTEEKQFL